MVDLGTMLPTSLGPGPEPEAGKLYTAEGLAEWYGTVALHLWRAYVSMGPEPAQWGARAPVEQSTRAPAGVTWARRKTQAMHTDPHRGGQTQATIVLYYFETAEAIEALEAGLRAVDAAARLGAVNVAWGARSRLERQTAEHRGGGAGQRTR